MISTRRLSPVDAGELKKFFEANALPFFDDAGSQPESYLGFFLQSPTRSCFAAFFCDSASSGKEIVGFGSIDVLARPRGGRIAYLGEVYVSTPARRQGVATKVIQALTREAMILGCHRVILHCSYGAALLYERSGFYLWEQGMRLDLAR